VVRRRHGESRVSRHKRRWDGGERGTGRNKKQSSYLHMQVGACEERGGQIEAKASRGHRKLQCRIGPKIWSGERRSHLVSKGERANGEITTVNELS